MGRVRIAEVLVAAGLVAVVAFRPDVLQPVGTFVSDMLVQEADADDGGSTNEPTAKSTRGNADKQDDEASPETSAKTSAETSAKPKHKQTGKQKKDQRG